eukprot:CAMPEP_0202691842 /NCGR_PEP_ID=MMETSP1385-20130828/6433_1 /ASSEMBLY_ACC=CAM_ASM_000861 /TAXON_ID=933848 /ORGANISM="Elphidium margaritaceum" /LENGTH=176 /DNA_ID=CAMNT_0049347299 /DNA_START=45 /DNA_END=575 /DNA_ORIENTATION=+
MTSVVASNHGRKRSRQELETDIDNLEIKDAVCCASPIKKKPRKAMDHCTQILNVTTATVKSNQNASRKRKISDTDFEKQQNATANVNVNAGENQRASKRMRTQATDQKDDESDIDDRTNDGVDDVLMQCVQKPSTPLGTDDHTAAAAAIKINYPAHRIRRSGLEFCVQCGISGMVA